MLPPGARKRRGQKVPVSSQYVYGLAYHEAKAPPSEVEDGASVGGVGQSASSRAARPASVIWARQAVRLPRKRETSS